MRTPLRLILSAEITEHHEESEGFLAVYLGLALRYVMLNRVEEGRKEVRPPAGSPSVKN